MTVQVAPIEILREELDERGIAFDEFLSLLSRPRSRSLAMLKGESPLTASMATDLERLLGVSAMFWLRLGRRYRAWAVERAASEEG